MITETNDNSGALLIDMTEEQLKAIGISDNPPEEIPEMPEVSAEISESSEYPHVRYPRVHRSGSLIVMALSAVCGVIGGVLLSANTEITQNLESSLLQSFGEIFLNRTIIGAVFLATEYILGFFALGDMLVWSVPLVAGLGLAFRVAVTREWILLPSSILLLIVTAFAGAVSAGLSSTLMQLSRGGTIHLGESPRRQFTLNFLGFLALSLICALYEGIILTV